MEDELADGEDDENRIQRSDFRAGRKLKAVKGAKGKKKAYEKKDECTPEFQPSPSLLKRSLAATGCTSACHWEKSHGLEQYAKWKRSWSLFPLWQTGAFS